MEHLDEVRAQRRPPRCIRALERLEQLQERRGELPVRRGVAAVRRPEQGAAALLERRQAGGPQLVAAAQRRRPVALVHLAERTAAVELVLGQLCVPRRVRHLARHVLVHDLGAAGQRVQRAGGDEVAKEHRAHVRHARVVQDRRQRVRHCGAGHRVAGGRRGRRRRRAERVEPQHPVHVPRAHRALRRRSGQRVRRRPRPAQRVRLPALGARRHRGPRGEPEQRAGKLGAVQHRVDAPRRGEHLRRGTRHALVRVVPQQRHAVAPRVAAVAAAHSSAHQQQLALLHVPGEHEPAPGAGHIGHLDGADKVAVREPRAGVPQRACVHLGHLARVQAVCRHAGARARRVEPRRRARLARHATQRVTRLGVRAERQQHVGTEQRVLHMRRTIEQLERGGRVQLAPRGARPLVSQQLPHRGVHARTVRAGHRLAAPHRTGERRLLPPNGPPGGRRARCLGGQRRPALPRDERRGLVKHKHVRRRVDPDPRRSAPTGDGTAGAQVVGAHVRLAHQQVRAHRELRVKRLALEAQVRRKVGNAHGQCLAAGEHAEERAAKVETQPRHNAQHHVAPCKVPRRLELLERERLQRTRIHRGAVRRRVLEHLPREVQRRALALRRGALLGPPALQRVLCREERPQRHPLHLARALERLALARMRLDLLLQRAVVVLQHRLGRAAHERRVKHGIARVRTELRRHRELLREPLLDSWIRIHERHKLVARRLRELQVAQRAKQLLHHGATQARVEKFFSCASTWLRRWFLPDSATRRRVGRRGGRAMHGACSASVTMNNEERYRSRKGP